MMENMAILYGIPKVAYGTEGCTPFPMSIKSCAEYLGIVVTYSQIMVESGAAFRLVWDTSCWNGGNVDSIFTFDDPTKIFVSGLRTMRRDFKMLPRTKETKKENPDTCAVIATGTEIIAPFTSKEVLQNAAEVLEGRMCGTYAKGLMAYDAWKNALL